MGRIFVKILAATIAFAFVAPNTAFAANSTYTNCQNFNKKYPAGVAKSVATADAAVGSGHQMPRVSSRVFKSAVAQNAKLGGPSDGVLCEAAPIKIVPSSPQALTAVPDATAPSSAIVLSWQPPATDGYSPLLGYTVSDGVRSFSTTETTFTVTSLAAKTTFKFTVTANNAIGPSPVAPVTAATEKQKLILPDNSGWTLVVNGTSASLKAQATPGLVLPLGNAPTLGISLYGDACSGEWYTSAFVQVQLLDAAGNVIPGRFGYTEELLGYSAGYDFNSSGCGGETLSLSTYPSAASVKVISSSGRFPGSIYLFAGAYL